MSMRFALSKMIYPQACLESAIAAYSDFCSVKVIGDASGAREIEIVPLPDEIDHPDEERVVHEFLNYLLDLALEHHLQKA